MTDNLTQHILDIYRKYMRLKIFIDSEDNELKNKYIQTIDERHLKMLNNLKHLDSGLDLFAPEQHIIDNANVQKIDYKIICCAEIVEQDKVHYNTGFYIYPRSSISKSNIRLANNVGIIDAGYRGHLMAMFDVIYKKQATINKFDRHLQICAPCLAPIIVEIVNSKKELGEQTSRAAGGFGSTGL